MWIPFEWPAVWKDAGALRLVEGTAVNCLLDAPPAVREAARARGFDCPEIAWHALKEIDWRTPAEVCAIGDGVWPRIEVAAGTAQGAEAAPTGQPWLDANGWRIQLARARAGGRPVWIRSPHTEQDAAPRFPEYQLALAEAFVYGARRPIRLDPAHASALAAGDAKTRGEWRELIQLAGWFAAHGNWDQWQVVARVLVASDFSGPNEYIGTEVLNLAARRNLAFRIVLRDRLTAQALAGMQAVLWADNARPSPAQRQALAACARRGGLVCGLQTALAEILPAGSPRAEAHPRLDVFRLGQGRVALAKGEWDDPYVLTGDLHLLLSRRWDGVRFFNAGSILTHATISPDARSRLLHLLNYTAGPSFNLVSARLDVPPLAARLLLPGAQAQPLPVQLAGGRPELHLPQCGVYAAIELRY